MYDGDPAADYIISADFLAGILITIVPRGGWTSVYDNSFAGVWRSCHVEPSHYEDGGIRGKKVENENNRKTGWETEEAVSFGKTASAGEEGERICQGNVSKRRPAADYKKDLAQENHPVIHTYIAGFHIVAVLLSIRTL